jgi:peptidoglycan/LPS O-acetylase OafA/YrhL
MRRRVPALDGLRAVAVAAVVVYHADRDWLPGGFLGVDLFFVLSGFLITTLLLEQLQASGGPGLPTFYVRRARRLLPALVGVVILTLLVMAGWWRSDLEHHGRDVPAVLGFVGNWWYVVQHQDYFVAIGRPSPFQHLWSLGVEEQFYLVWPVTLWLAWRTGRGARHAAVAVVALGGALASAAWMAHLAVAGDVPYRTAASRIYYGTDTHAVGLLLGAAAAAARLDLLRRGRAVPAWVPRIVRADAIVIAATAGIVALAWRTSEFDPRLYRTGFVVFSAVALVAVVGATHAGGVSVRLLANPPMRWLGERSYGIYLWHWPVFVFTRPLLDVSTGPLATLALRLPLTLLLAEASYRWVEMPIRRRGFRAVVTELFGGLPERAIACSAAGVAVFAVTVVAMPRPAPVRLAAVGAGSVSAVATDVVHHRSTPHAGLRHIRRHRGPAVTLIGDSVMLGAESALRRDLGRDDQAAVFHVREGFQPSDALDLLAALARRHRIAATLVLHIGTNGPIDPSRLDRLLGSLREHRIVLVTDHMPQPWHTPNNHTIRAAGHRPDTVVVDWDAAAAQHRWWFWSDGIHVRAAGAEAYARMVTAALK